MDELEYLDMQFAKLQEEARLNEDADVDPYGRRNPVEGRAINTEQNSMRSESAQTRVGAGEAQEYKVIRDDEDNPPPPGEFRREPPPPVDRSVDWAINTEPNPFMRSESAQTRVGAGEAQEYKVMNDDDDDDDDDDHW